MLCTACIVSEIFLTHLPPVSNRRLVLPSSVCVSFSFVMLPSVHGHAAQRYTISLIHVYSTVDNKAPVSRSFVAPSSPKTHSAFASYHCESWIAPTHSTCSARPHCHCYSLTRTSFYPVQTTLRSLPDPQCSVSDCADFTPSPT